MAEQRRTDSPEQTHEFGRRFAEGLRAGDCIGLIGPLGAGKTALVRGIASGLGIEDDRMVSSPTYVLVQEYPGRATIYHIDLYRMANPDAELADLALDEMLEDGVVLIEWADRASESLHRPRREILIEIIGPSSRRLTVRELR